MNHLCMWHWVIIVPVVAYVIYLKGIVIADIKEDLDRQTKSLQRAEATLWDVLSDHGIYKWVPIDLRAEIRSLQSKEAIRSLDRVIEGMDRNKLQTACRDLEIIKKHLRIKIDDNPHIINDCNTLV